jgi:hypothetical protein
MTCESDLQDLQARYAVLHAKMNELAALQQTVAQATPPGSQYVPASQFKNLERIEQLKTEIKVLSDEYSFVYAIYEEECLNPLAPGMYKGGKKKQRKTRKTKKTRKAKGKRKH